MIYGYSTGGTVRKVKTDEKDAREIAQFALDHWGDLREYTHKDAVRQQLKICNRQYALYMKMGVSLQNNLISLCDKVFPGVNGLFSSQERADGHMKWVEFVTTFWHSGCVAGVSKNAFTERYRKWCKQHGYNKDNCVQAPPCLFSSDLFGLVMIPNILSTSDSMLSMVLLNLSCIILSQASSVSLI